MHQNLEFEIARVSLLSAFAEAYAFTFDERLPEESAMALLGRALRRGAEEREWFMNFTGATEESEKRYEYDFAQYDI